MDSGMPLKSCRWGSVGIILCFNLWRCEAGMADVPAESLKGGNLIMFKVEPMSYLDKWYGRLPFWYFIWDGEFVKDQHMIEKLELYHHCGEQTSDAS